MSEKKANSARVVAYTISDDIEKQIRRIILDILTAHERTELMAPIFASVKELIINAIKANYKNIYFEDYDPKNKSHEIIDYNKALELFKLEISRENINIFEEFARRDDLKAVIDLWTADKTLHVKVMNPVRMTETETINVNKKLTDAENCRDLADYCIKNIEDPHREGAGLGLVLIKMMLKSLNAPNDSLVISTDKNNTTAYLKIPL
ncbi:MAG: hypothetical protein KA369_07680 [Spirochaetes bacterium]|nr:hypothetical protein [Spirochaetota bacterium]